MITVKYIDCYNYGLLYIIFLRVGFKTIETIIEFCELTDTANIQIDINVRHQNRIVSVNN